MIEQPAPEQMQKQPSSTTRIRRWWTEEEDRILRAEADYQRNEFLGYHLAESWCYWANHKQRSGERRSGERLEPDSSKAPGEDQQGLSETLEQSMRAHQEGSVERCRR